MKADSRGFLIADQAVEVQDLAQGIEGVRHDTSAILNLLKSGQKAAIQRRQRAGRQAANDANAQASRASRAPSSRNAGASGSPTASRASSAANASGAARQSSATERARAAALARPRDARGRFVAAPEQTQVMRAVNALTRQQAAQNAEQKRAAASRERAGEAAAAEHHVNQTRDARGRFGSGGAGSSEDGGEGLLSRMKNVLGGKGGGIGADVGDFEKVDPTIEASKEVAKLVSGPLSAVGNVGKAVIGRGFSGPKDKTLPWFRRIYGVLKGSREDNSGYALAENRVLKDIERKTGGGAGGNAAHGVLSKIFGGGASLLGGLFGKGGGLLSMLGKGGKGLLKRLPLLGALFAGGSALASIFGGDDPNKTPEENRRDKFTGAGSGIGALIGGGLGMFLGPVGAMIGGVIGDKVGELVGAWLATVDWSKVGATITNAWDGAVTTVKDTWKKVTDGLGEVVDTVKKAWDGITSGIASFLKDKFGIDVSGLWDSAKKTVAPAVQAVSDTVKPAVDKAKELGGAAVDKAKEVGGAVADYASERASKMAAPITRAYDNAVDFGKGLVGGGSKANKAAVMAQAQTIADPNERAMFLAQVDHESGGFRSTVENTNYKAKGFLANFGKRNHITTEAQAQAILDQGEDAKLEAMYGGDWGRKNLGNVEPGDAAKFKGRGVMQLTGRDNYTRAGKALGIDLVNHPELLEDPEVSAKAAMWYWNDKKGLAAAGRAGDVSAATRAINGGANGLSHRDSLFASYRKGIANEPAIAMAAAPAAPPVVAAASVPPPPAVPSSATVPAPAAPPPTAQANIPQPMGSKPPIDVRVQNDTLAAQDLRDRRLAQIATGGIAT
jgi:predicted chitinase